MSENNLPVKQSGIGLAFIDELTREQKKEVVLAYVNDWLKPFTSNASAALVRAKSLEILSDSDLKMAIEMREMMRGEEKEIEQFHETRLSPSKKDIRDIEAQLNKAKKIEQEAMEILDKKISDVYLLEEAGRAAAQSTIGVILPQTPKTIRTDDAAVSIRKDIEIVITNLDALIKDVAAKGHPNFFLVADTSYIKKWCKMMDMTESNIPGIQIKQTAIVAGRKQ